jgi:hypothetical protein
VDLSSFPFNLARHFCVSSKYGLDDVMITSAPAEISFQFVPDSFFVEAVRMPFNYANGTHHHARGAKATLESVVFAEGFLHWVQCVAVGEALDCCDVGVFRLTGQYSAGLDWKAVNIDRAGTALAGVTAYMCAS